MDLVGSSGGGCVRLFSTLIRFGLDIGPWTLGFGSWTLDFVGSSGGGCVRWFSDLGSCNLVWALYRGPWILEAGPWTLWAVVVVAVFDGLDLGLWFGHWTLGLGLWKMDPGPCGQ